ncbi:MAG: DUF1648 domain-containing protein [Bacteroidetes bacterium]|nr:DUF1648 domain-containing protein [Bacteroidota bacterium]MCH8525333.1 DUF1648 domain-containing protein [Balneolales bacterium]
MPNPKIAIQKESIDYVIERAGFIGLIVLIAVPAYYFGSLPEEVPRHFGADGNPTAWAGKGIIWLLPSMGLILFVKMSILAHFPHIYNYPTKVTEENAERLYRLATRMIRSLNTLIVFVFLYITYSSILTALGEQDGLHPGFMFAFMGSMFLVIGYYIFQSYRKK